MRLRNIWEYCFTRNEPFELLKVKLSDRLAATLLKEKKKKGAFIVNDDKNYVDLDHI